MIETKLLRCFLLTIILVQFSWARPAAENDFSNLSFGDGKDVCLKKIKYDELKSAENDGALLQLLKFTLNAFQNLALDSAKKAKEISENILKHPDIVSSQSPKVVEFKKHLTQFEAKYSSCDSLEDLFELVEVFTNATEYYLDSDENSFDADAKFIAELLHKYGSEDIENKAWNNLKEFVPKFKNKVESLKQDLNKEEGEVGEKLLEWFTQFKTLSGNEEKIESFVQFFSLFDNEEE